jgi:hypothetical protein
MSHAIRIAFLLIGLALPAFAKGITVRFLPNPPEDSIAKYAVLRADGAAAPVQVGEVPALPARDTFAYADTAAARGRAYVYSIVAIDAAGNASDPSDSTEVALPSLGLPDTLSGAAADARWSLPAGADPLTGVSPLSLSLEDTTRFSLRLDSLTHTAVFATRGAALSGWAMVRAAYFGKFIDRDSVWLSFGSAGAVTALRAPGPGPACRLPSSWSFARQGALRVQAGAAAAAHGRLDIVTARGEAVASMDLPGNGSEVLWDGKDGHGRLVKPASYLWAARGPRGAMLQSGALRLEP